MPRPPQHLAVDTSPEFGVSSRSRTATPVPSIAPLAVGDGLDAETWADHEFGGARLGDARLSARLVRSAQRMAESPTRAITGATNGVRALVKGHYRLIDQPAGQRGDGRQHPRAASRAHAAPDAGARHGAVHPGRHAAEFHPVAAKRRGWGHIGSNQTGAVARGLELHTTLAVNPDGVALGVLRAAFDAPADPEAEGQPRAKPREERKSFRWVEGLRDCAQAAEQLSETRVVCVLDREADFLEPVRRAAHGCPTGRPAGPRQGRPRLGQGKDARRADGLAPSVRYGAQRAGPRRRPGRGAAAERAREGQQTGPQGPPCGAGRRRDAALPAGAAALPRRRAGHTVGRPRARGTTAARGRAAGVVPADHVACDQPRRRHAHPAMVRSALAHRRVLPGAQVGLQGRGVAAPLGRAARTRHGHQDGPRMAHPVDGPARTRSARPAEATCCSPMASCACSPPSPAHASCRRRRASATLSVWSGASAGGSDANATRPAHSCLWHGYTQLVAMAFAFELRDEFG